MEFTDDVSGQHLDARLAVKARKLEMDFFRRMRVYTEVPRSQVRNKKVISIEGKGGTKKMLEKSKSKIFDQYISL